tara:strand:+ start:2680 stop:2964 length:285 start_codon:yes stop_codon:yes gene_type:complete
MAKALPGNKRKYGENLYTETYTPPEDKGLGGGLKSSGAKIKDLDNKASTQTQVDIKPKNSEGVSGDRRIVREGRLVYIYYKVENEWMKTVLEKA